MFEQYTYEYIMENALARVKTKVDKRQGSIIWDALAPACAELAQMYIQLDYLLKITYAETSYGEWLDKRCREMGVHRESATYAIRLGEMFGRNNVPMDVPIGAVFSIETINFVAMEKIADGQYKLRCQQAGVIGNQLFGKMIPVETISGLVSAQLLDVLIPGEDEENDERLFERYEEKVNSTPYGGNIDDYKQKTRALEGVGDCKVFPVWQGGGTVKVTVIDSDYAVPSNNLIETIQEVLDPVPYGQQGLGLAPIGHLVTVKPVQAVEINLSTKLVLRSGYTIGQFQTLVEETLHDYLLELNRGWAKEDSLIIRINQLEARILNIDGLLDISDTTLNGGTANIVLGEEQIPTVGEVNVYE